MKTCVSSYSFGSYINPDKLGLMGIIDKAAEYGFDGFEFTGSGWQKDNDPGWGKEVGDYTRSKGLATPSYCVSADLLNGGKEEIERVKKQVDFAAALGVANMRHDCAWGFRPDRKYSIGYDDALPVISDAAREITKYAEQKGVGTMTENHGQFSQDALRIEKLINTVAHPNFGALVDIGNFMCADEDPYYSVGIMARYAKHVHVKDFFFRSATEFNPGTGWFTTRGGNYLRGAIIGHGVACVPQTIGLLKNSGYDGFLSIEFEGMEDNLDGIRYGLENLKRFMEIQHEI